MRVNIWPPFQIRHGDINETWIAKLFWIIPLVKWNSNVVSLWIISLAEGKKVWFRDMNCRYALARSAWMGVGKTTEKESKIDLKIEYVPSEYFLDYSYLFNLMFVDMKLLPPCHSETLQSVFYFFLNYWRCMFWIDQLIEYHNSWIIEDVFSELTHWLNIIIFWIIEGVCSELTHWLNIIIFESLKVYLLN